MKISADFEFPRAWKDTTKDGVEFSVTTQPYVSGLYVSISGPTHEQTVIAYSSVRKFIKNLQSEKSTAKDLVLDRIGDYLSESQLRILTS
jgi:hypothetical protein